MDEITLSLRLKYRRIYHFRVSSRTPWANLKSNINLKTLNNEFAIFRSNLFKVIQDGSLERVNIFFLNIVFKLNVYDDALNRSN